MHDCSTRYLHNPPTYDHAHPHRCQHPPLDIDQVLEPQHLMTERYFAKGTDVCTFASLALHTYISKAEYGFKVIHTVKTESECGPTV